MAVETATPTLATILVPSEEFVTNSRQEEEEKEKKKEEREEEEEEEEGKSTVSYWLQLWNTIFLLFPAWADTAATSCCCNGHNPSRALELQQKWHHRLLTQAHFTHQGNGGKKSTGG